MTLITPMTKEEFARLLPEICYADTSFDPRGWTEENPLWGHCVVVTVLAQELFGGWICGVLLKDTKFAKLQFHVWNWFPDETLEDFTAAQFGGDYPGELAIYKWEPAELLADPRTRQRLELLRTRLIGAQK